MSNTTESVWTQIKRGVYSVIGIITVGILLLSASEIPEWIDRWGKHFQAMPDLDFDSIKYGLLVVCGVILIVTNIPWMIAIKKKLRPPRIDPLEGPRPVRPRRRPERIRIPETPRDRLEICYEPDTHFIENADGSVDIRLSVRNMGRTRIRLSAVKILDCVALTHKTTAQPMAARLVAFPLAIFGNIGMAIDAGDVVKISFARIDANAEHFFLTGSEYNTTLQFARYRLRVIASGKTGLPDEKAFILSRTRRGRTTFKIDESRDTDPRSSTA